MAVAGKMAAAHFNTPEHEIFNHQVIVLAGDGCLQEGVAAEAASLAGHLALDNLTIIYDSNDVTLDAMADASQSESVIDRFAAYGFNCIRIEDGHDMQAIADALSQAEKSNWETNFCRSKNHYCQGYSRSCRHCRGHGEGGAKFAESARKGLVFLMKPSMFLMKYIPSLSNTRQIKHKTATMECNIFCMAGCQS